MISRRLLPIGLAAGLALAACGGSSDSEGEAADTLAPTTTEQPAEPTEDFTQVDEDEETTTTEADQPAATAAAATTVAPGGGDEAAEGDVAVSMVEWSIDAPTEYSAGEVTFVATNNGNFPHEFAVVRGDGYESLPLADGGAIIEDELPAGALLDRTERMGAGSTQSLTVTMEPGNYVLVCNLGAGANNHAGQGQVLDITVS